MSLGIAISLLGEEGPSIRGPSGLSVQAECVNAMTQQVIQEKHSPNNQVARKSLGKSTRMLVAGRKGQSLKGCGWALGVCYTPHKATPTWEPESLRPGSGDYTQRGTPRRVWHLCLGNGQAQD